MENKPVTKLIRSFIGEVVSASMNKTIVVRVETLKKIPKYNKSLRLNSKYHVHDEKGIAKVGNKVKFVECRPLSKTKRWRLVEVIK